MFKIGVLFKKFVPETGCFFVVLIFIINTTGLSQDISNPRVRLMFYNVENLFDIYDDTIKDDSNFLPKGLMRWNFTRYSNKINSLYKTIIAAGDWNPPDVVAFCEVENRNVLEDLVYGTYLSKFDYKIIHEESPDIRGIDVCLIYREEFIDVIDYYYWVPADSKERQFTSRSVLYAKLRAYSDTLHLIVNHWPSRRGGALASEYQRKRVATMVKEKTDSLFSVVGTEAKIIILGDFNCYPEDEVMCLITGRDEEDNLLVNLSKPLADEGLGTYRYMGIWEMIDQVIISEGLIDPDKGLYTASNPVNIFRADFLLVKDPKYPGYSPFSTYLGFRYRGGYSDHLPVLIDLKLKDQGRQE